MNTNNDSVLDVNVSEREDKKIREREKYLSHIGITLTEKCNINCRHCIVDCNSISKNEWNGNSLNRLIKQIRLTNLVNTIGFTGGEPFLDFERLKNAVIQCTVLGINTSVVTNGYWASDSNIAQNMLNILNGLSKIAVSTDKFHREFISIQNVKNIIKIANENEIKCQIRVSHLNDPIGEIGEITQHLSKFEGKYELTSQPVQYFGRAATHLERRQLYSYEALSLACRTADRVLFLTSGEVLACCGPQDSIAKGHPLWLGDIGKDSVEKIFERADTNPIIHIIRLWGPGELVRILEEQAKRENISIPPPTLEETREICSLCRYVLDSDVKLKLLNSAIREQNLTHAIAAARLLNFAETSMILHEE